MIRADAEMCPANSGAEHQWIETTTMQDAGRRFICKWCSIEAWEPIKVKAVKELNLLRFKRNMEAGAAAAVEAGHLGFFGGDEADKFFGAARQMEAAVELLDRMIEAKSA